MTELAAEPVEGVLFDVDGTLVDTNYLHTVAWARALQRCGEPADMWRIHRLVGMGSDRLLDDLLGHDVEGAADARLEEFARFHDEIRAFPGAAELVREVRGRGLTVVLASSADADDLDACRRALDVDDAVDVVTGADDADASKPSPDIFAIACERAGLDPARAAVIGDTVWDVEAAAKIGLRCIGVLTGGIPEADLRDAGAVEVHRDPQALLDDLRGPGSSILAGSRD